MAEPTQPDYGKVLAEWTFPEFIKHKRTRRWFLWMALAIFGLLIFSIWTRSYLFIIIIFLVILIQYIRNKREPLNVPIQISEEGILIGESFYPYKEIKGFWIIYEPPDVKTLYLDFKSSLRPYLSISLVNQNPIRLRKILLQYLQEDLTRENESLSDAVARYLKL